MVVTISEISEKVARRRFDRFCMSAFDFNRYRTVENPSTSITARDLQKARLDPCSGPLGGAPRAGLVYVATMSEQGPRPMDDRLVKFRLGRQQ